MTAPIVTIPKLATRFALWRVHARKGTNAEGKKYRVNANERLYGDADKATGEVAETWPVAAWNTKTIVDRWGPARYLVHWLDDGGERIGSKTFLLDSPRKGKASINAPTDETSPAASPAAPMGTRESFGPFEVFQMLREERAEAEARVHADAERSAERDRAHQSAQMAMMLELVKAQRTSGASQASSFDPNLLRRELAVTVREQMQQIRAELTGLVPKDEPGAGDGGNPDPDNLEDAAEQVGIELLKQVAKDAPGVLQKAVPALLDWMRRHGVEPNPAIQAKLAGADRARAAAEAAAAALSDGVGNLEEEDDDANAG